MPIVSNTSPILNLAIIDELQLLRRQFEDVLIPEAVLEELRTDDDLPGSQAIRNAIEEGWIQVCELNQKPLAKSLHRELDTGEAEAIALALETSSNSILMDERDGRKVAKSFGLNVVGAIGVLLLARKEGYLESFQNSMEQLREKAGFHIRKDLYDRLIESSK